MGFLKSLYDQIKSENRIFVRKVRIIGLQEWYNYHMMIVSFFFICISMQQKEIRMQALFYVLIRRVLWTETDMYIAFWILEA